MVQLYTCQARPVDAVDPHTRCGADVSPNTPFCAEHYEEYRTLAERASGANAEIEELDEPVEDMARRGADAYGDLGEVERDAEDARRFLHALGEQVETRAVLSRRFFSEPEYRAQSDLTILNERRIAVSGFLRRLEERGAVVAAEEQRRAEEAQRKAEEDERLRQEEERQRQEEEQRRQEEARLHEEQRQREEARQAEERRRREEEEEAAERRRVEEAEREAREAQRKEEERAAAEKRAKEYKEEIKRRREQEKRKEAEERRRKAERGSQVRPGAQTKVAGGGNGGGGRSGLEIAGTVLLVGVIVGVALFCGVRNKEVLKRLARSVH